MLSTVRGTILGKAGNLFLLQKDQTFCGVRPTTYTMVTSGADCGAKVAGARSSIYCRV